MAVTFAAVGELNGNRFNGGRRSGWRFFFLGVAEFCFCCSRSELELGGACLDLFGSRSFLTGSRAEFLPEMLLVEELLILLASKGMLDFLLAKKGVSEGESLGDS